MKRFFTRLLGLLVFSTFFLTQNIQAQITYKIDDFSKHFYVKEHFSKTGNTFNPTLSKGWIAVYTKSTDALLFKVEKNKQNGYIDKGPLHGKNVPKIYFKQNAFYFKDVNFDKKKDFVIQDGRHSCYGGPSYKIYLADREGFSFSQSFTDLAQYFCGMFGVDSEKKRLYTMTKSGCCWHQYTTYKVKDNKPYLVHRKEEDAQGLGVTIDYTIYNRENGKLKESYYRKINTWLFSNDDGSYTKNLVVTQTFQNGKRMYLFYNGDNNEEVYYAFVDANGVIELLYDGNMMLKETDGQSYIEFSNKEATYNVYNTKLVILVGGKTYTMKPIEVHGKVQYFFRG